MTWHSHGYAGHYLYRDGRPVACVRCVDVEWFVYVPPWRRFEYAAVARCESSAKAWAENMVKRRASQAT